MIIKKSEWDALKDENVYLYAKINELSKELEILKETKKPETITIQTYVSSPYINDWKIYTTSELNLSRGIKNQCLRILSNVTEQIRPAIISTLEAEIQKEVRIAISNEKHDFYLKSKDFQKRLNSLPWYTSKKKILKLFNTKML